MALINCPECGRENVSDSAEMCPKCGYGIRAHFDRIKQEEINKQEKIRMEELQKKKEAEEKEREEKRIASVPEPECPKFSQGLILYIAIATIFFSWGFLYFPTTYYENPEVGKWMLELIVFIGVPLLIYLPKYNKRKKDYELACTDFEAYQKQVIKEQDEAIARKQQAEEQKMANAVKCPNCGSLNTKEISTISRAISVEMVGLASSKIGKQYECKKCGYKW